MDAVLDIEALLEKCELVQLVRTLRKRKGRSRLFGDAVKPVTADQIARLVAQGCESTNWLQIYATDGFDPRAISHVRFEGTCVLGRFSKTHEIAPGVQVPAGIHHSTLVNCEVGNDALIRDVGLAANYLIGDGALVSSVGEVIASARPTFGNGTSIAVGVETGERAIAAFAELDLDLACQLACAPAGSDLRKAYGEFLQLYLKEISLRRGYVGAGAVVRVCRRLSDVLIGDAAVIEGCAAITNSTLLSNREEVTRIGENALVRNSLVQWGCEITTGALVESSLLTEHSHVERHGKVTHSILGPNTAVAGGEVTCALLGPFVGFHHQALLIATLWPAGKGNVGYGANVGSNHTGKAPDQELWPGEGMFFGLGANVKFPANFARAPYTMIATGVTTLPQKVEFPFSLINSPAAVYEGISPAFNEIIPGWVLSDNAYALARNETKFRDRNKARRLNVEFDVLRPETSDLIGDARQRLLDAPPKKPAQPDQPVLYLERDIPGLGKNFMLESSRARAIETYSFYLRFYALRGLYRRLVQIAQTAGAVGNLEAVLSQPAPTLTWAHQLETLGVELPGKSVCELLELWVEHFDQFAKSVVDSKERDDERGARIIPDYRQFHEPAPHDKVIRQIVAEGEEIRNRVAAWLKK